MRNETKKKKKNQIYTQKTLNTFYFLFFYETIYLDILNFSQYVK